MTTTDKTNKMTEKRAQGTAKKGGRPKAGEALGSTLEELAEIYLLHLEQIGKSRGTVFSYSIDLAVAVRELGKETRVKTLTPERIGAFFGSDAVMKTRAGKPKAKPTIDKTRRVLRLALVWAAETGEIPVAPIPEDVVDGRKARGEKGEAASAAKTGDGTKSAPKKGAANGAVSTRRRSKKPRVTEVCADDQEDGPGSAA